MLRIEMLKQFAARHLGLPDRDSAPRGLQRLQEFIRQVQQDRARRYTIWPTPRSLRRGY